MSRFSSDFQSGLIDLMRWRRDVRRFRTDPVDEALLAQCLDTFLFAPSVGLSEPWRIISVDSDTARARLYLHGGGYALGSIATHRGLAGRLARDLGCRVLILDYRLAPEHPFPAAVEDAVAALAYAWEHGPGGRRAPARAVYVCGDSAGGGLALYATPENPDGSEFAVERFAGNNGLGISGRLDGAAFDLMITPGECSDGMSDRTYPYTATLLVGDEQRQGCAWTDSQAFGEPELP